MISWQKYFRQGLALACLGVLASGCTSKASWDKEYTCSGEEQSSAYFPKDAAAPTIQKTYPVTIDFHVRSNSAFIKSHVAALDSTPEGTLRFSTRGPQTWITGQFDPRSGTLTAIEGRALTIAGQTQQIRTSGQYTCK